MRAALPQLPSLTECAVAIPQYGGSITINGHQAKVLVTDFDFGGKTLLYSTAEVLTYAVIDQKNVLVLWLPAGESGEFAIRGATGGNATAINGSASTASSVNFHPGSSNLTVSYTQAPGMTVVDLDDGTRVVLLDRSAAYLFWVPTLSNDPTAPANDTGRAASLFVFQARTLLTRGISAGPRTLSRAVRRDELDDPDPRTDGGCRLERYGTVRVCSRICLLRLVERQEARHHGNKWRAAEGFV